MTIPAKEALLRLVDHIEEMYIENLILRDELRKVDQGALDQVIRDAKKSSGLRQKVSALFAPVRLGLLQESLLEREIEEFLKAAPPTIEN